MKTDEEILEAFEIVITPEMIEAGERLHRSLQPSVADLFRPFTI